MLQVLAESYEVTPYETETTSPSLPICCADFPFTETSTAPALPTLRLTRVVALKFNFWPFLIWPLNNVVPFESETNNHEFPRLAVTFTNTPVPED